MKAILIDAYRSHDEIVVWLKEPDNVRVRISYPISVYARDCDLAIKVLDNLRIPYSPATRSCYDGQVVSVLRIDIGQISQFERIVGRVERASRFRLDLFDADIAPEQRYLYENGLRPFTPVKVVGKRIVPLHEEGPAVGLSRISINAEALGDVRSGHAQGICAITVDGERIEGDEMDVLARFAARFASQDPDVVIMDSAFLMLPYLESRLAAHGISCPFHRWDSHEIKPKGGKPFFSYGRVVYRDYAVRLNGRFLIDSETVVGTECDIESIMELSTLSGARFQQLASRSFGAVFQTALIGEMIRRGNIIPYKQKPVDQPVSMDTLLKADRVGLTLDPITGFHTDVAEIDFSSLFPWIIYNYNISPETLNSGEEPHQDVPGLPFRVSLRRKGIVPTAIKPLLDRRMEYKRNPAANRVRLQGLKWVLVTSYGYLRFREFKLGAASTHMAIGAFAREILLKAKGICEERGFGIVHGIIDSLYLHKRGITEEDVRTACKDIELESGVPVAFEGIFRWVVFLPSVNDPSRPVPARYYGVFRNGDIKARGIEVRQRGVPLAVKAYQRACLEEMAKCWSAEEIMKLLPRLCGMGRDVLRSLPALDRRLLTAKVTVSRTDYKHNIPQKRIIERLKKKGVRTMPGQTIRYIHSTDGAVLPEEDAFEPDIPRYRRLLCRSLFILLEPFGVTREDIDSRLDPDRQARITDYRNSPDYDKGVIASIELRRDEFMTRETW